MKRAQIEIIGLVIIVIIITIVFLFSLKFRVQSQTRTQRNTFANDQLATNMLLGMLKTDHPVCKVKVEKLVYDCAGERKITCRDGNNACFHINQTMAFMLSQSLDLMQSKYLLRIMKLPEEELVFRFDKQCGPNQPKGMQGYQPISLYPAAGRVDVMLDICT